MAELCVQLVACDAESAANIRGHFEARGVRIQTTDTLGAAPNLFEEGIPDVVVLDADHDTESVLTHLAEVKRLYPELPVVLVAGGADMPLVVEAMRAGAFDFVAKPLDVTRLQISIQNASQMHRLMVRVNQLQEKYQRSGSFQNLIGQSPQMRQIYDMIEHVSRADVTVFITGESGTGKELVAEAIHALSERRTGRFIAVNCASIPRDLLESELFGHEKGAYTGAVSRYLGCCEQADGGTLFLDEICEMDPQLQSKMLRFLQARTFHRLGGNEQIKVDVRIVAATNRDPMEEIRRGRLREDLFYRLNVVPIEAPPLRTRVGDVPILTNHFLERFAAKYGKYFYDFTPETVDLFQRYDWPGNVRELENVIERIVVLNNASQVTEAMLPQNIRDGISLARGGDPSEAPRDPDVILPFTEVEKREIGRALRICGWNVAKAAESLELGQATLYRKIKKYNIRLLRKVREPMNLRNP